MKMFRSFSRPVTKTGRTSNITGSRIKTSARTLREKSASLVENARTKLRQSSVGKGYTDAAGKRSNPVSAEAAGESMRKKAYNAGASNFGKRQAKFSAMKSASAPAGSGTGYKVGYKAGALASASRYKANLTQAATRTAQAPRPHVQGGSYTKVVDRARTGLENRGVRTAKLVATREGKAVVQAARETGRELGSLGRTMASQGRTAARAAKNTVGLAQDVARYGEMRAAGGARLIGKAAGRAIGRARTKLADGIAAAKVGQSAADRMAGYVTRPAERVLAATARAGSSIIRAAGRAIDRTVNTAAGMYYSRQASKAAQAIAAKRRPSVLGVRGATTPMGRNSVVAGVRYGNAMSAKSAANAAAANPTPWPGYKGKMGVKGQVSPSGRNSVATAVRYNNVMAQKKKAAPAKIGWAGKTPNWSAYQPQAAQAIPQPSANPPAATAPAKAAGIRKIRAGNLNKYASAVQRSRASLSGRPPAMAGDTTAPIVARARTAQGSLIPVGEPAQEKRGRGRPKLTPDQQVASRERRNQLRRERRSRKASG